MFIRKRHQKLLLKAIDILSFVVTDNNIAIVINFELQDYYRIIYLIVRFLSYILQLYRGSKEGMNLYFYMDLNKLFTRVFQLNFLRKCVFLFSDGEENVLYFEVWFWPEAKCWNNSYGKAQNTVIDKTIQEAIWVSRFIVNMFIEKEKKVKL